MIAIEEFCDLHDACDDGRDWALANCETMADVWATARPDWLVWVATRPGVLDDRTLRWFASFFARSVEHLLTDQRSRDAIDVAERHAKGLASDEELAASSAAAYAASAAARAASNAAAWASSAASYESSAAAYASSAAAWASSAAAESAAYAAWAAARAATCASSASSAAAWAASSAAARERQATWLREHCMPNFETLGGE